MDETDLLVQALNVALEHRPELFALGGDEVLYFRGIELPRAIVKNLHDENLATILECIADRAWSMAAAARSGA